MKTVNSVLSMYGTTIFETMSALARENDAINLGQGFPDQDGPAMLKEAAAMAMVKKPNQYPPMQGVPELRKAVAMTNKRFYGLEVDWESDVLVTSGATEALAACMLALLDPGDEVVVIEPLYDSYMPMILRAGGVPQRIRLSPPEWTLTREMLEEVFSERTKMILLNSPQNPAGKVYSAEELALIAEMVERYDTFAICDEVYEHIIYDDHSHIPLMSLPGMFERCVRISSAGKTFSMTGWKVGYVTATGDVMAAITKAHQFLTFTTPPLLQHAVEKGLRQDDTYFNTLKTSMQQKRDLLARGLKRAKFEVLNSAGTYFLVADIRPTGFEGTDIDFCQHITEQAGVTALPMSAFYVPGERRWETPAHFVRFCFCKRDEVLESASEKLRQHFASG